MTTDSHYIDYTRDVFGDALEFYQRKVAANKRRHQALSNIAVALFAFGGLALLLDSFRAFETDTDAGRQAFSVFGLGFSAIAAFLLAFGAAVRFWIERRGYMNAWMRSGLAAAQIRTLLARLELDIRVQGRDAPELQPVVREAFEQLNQLVLAEREQWARDARRDLESLLSDLGQSENEAGDARGSNA